MKSKTEPDGRKVAAAPVARTVRTNIVENLHAPEVYADRAVFYQTKGGNIAITFSSVRFDNSIDPPLAKHVTVARLVPAMPARTDQAPLELISETADRRRRPMSGDQRGAATSYSPSTV